MVAIKDWVFTLVNAAIQKGILMKNQWISVVLMLSSFTSAPVLAQHQSIDRSKIDFSQLDRPESPNLSKSQIERFVSEFSRPLGDAKLEEGRASASQAFIRVIRVMSCSDSAQPAKHFRELLPPGRNGNSHVSPKVTMKFHPSGACLSIKNTSDWKMLAKNAISFRVLYSSDESDETRTQRLDFMRQTDGAWVLKSSSLF